MKPHKCEPVVVTYDTSRVCKTCDSWINPVACPKCRGAGYAGSLCDDCKGTGIKQWKKVKS